MIAWKTDRKELNETGFGTGPEGILYE